MKVDYNVEIPKKIQHKTEERILIEDFLADNTKTSMQFTYENKEEAKKKVLRAHNLRAKLDKTITIMQRDNIVYIYKCVCAGSELSKGELEKADIKIPEALEKKKISVEEEIQKKFPGINIPKYETVKDDVSSGEIFRLYSKGTMTQKDISEKLGVSPKKVTDAIQQYK